MKRLIQLSISIVIGALFLWLAFRNVEWSSLVVYIRQMSYGWIPPFIIVSLLSHYFRAERWKMLLDGRRDRSMHRSILFSGLMIGYVVNYAIPRAGEVSRAVYVGRKEREPVSSVIGSVVVERAVDLTCLILLFLFVIFYMVTDHSLIRQLFGDEMMNWLHHIFTFRYAGITAIWVIGILLAIGILYKGLVWLGRHARRAAAIEKKITDIAKVFWRGLMSIRRVRNWPMFLLTTVLMWCCYVVMSYIPFYMFNMVAVYHLTLIDALTLTVIASVGIAIPSPGGMGTYHWFVKQTLWVLFAVPPVVGLAYAFVTYFATLLMFLCVTPLSLLWVHLRRPGKAEADVARVAGGE